MRKTAHLLLQFVIFICATHLFAQVASTNVAKTSIVKITTEERIGQGNKAVYNATGFCWKDSQHVVTTLHAVAGMKNIKISIPPGRDKETTAEIVRVYKKADLALLKLHKDIGLKPLKEADANPNSMSSFVVWGYPHDIYMIQGKPLNFNFGTEPNPTLNSILAGSNTKTLLERQTYPNMDMKIFRVGTTIRPGHSGAPILNADNQVIGVAEGGLKNGVAGINWAIRSKEYLDELDKSQESTSLPKSAQQDLFSSKTIVPVEASEEEIQQILTEEYNSSTISSESGKEVHRTWQATLEDIALTLDEEDIRAVQTIINEGYVYVSDTFDVYEDYETGATFAVPTGFKVNYQDGFFMVQGDELIFAFAPINSNSFGEARLQLDYFIAGIMGEYPYNRSIEGFTDENTVDELNDYAEKYIYRQVEYQGGQYMISVGGVVDESNVAAMYLDTKLPSDMSANQLREFFLFALASELASFSKY